MKTAVAHWRSTHIASANTSALTPQSWAAWMRSPSPAEWERTAQRSARRAWNGWSFLARQSGTSEPTRSSRWLSKRRRSSSLSPLPVPDLRHVLAVARDVLAMLHELVAHALAQMSRLRTQCRNVIDHGFDEMEAV